MNRFRKILVGVDCGAKGPPAAASLRAVEQARSLAQKSGAEVTLLHSTWDDRVPRSPDMIDRAVDEYLKPLADEVREDGITTHLEVSSEAPGIAVIREALRSESDLVLAGRGGGRTGHRPGSTALHLLRDCPAPIWLLHPGQRGEPTRFLAATDMSPMGDMAVELAARLAEAHDAELHLVHALSKVVEMQIAKGRISDEELRQRELDAVRDAMRAMRDSVDSEREVTPRLHVVIGDPTEAILEANEALLPDLLIMGTQSRTGIPGMLLGNTAERVLAKLPASLLAIKPEGFEAPSLFQSPGDELDQAM